MSDPSVDVFNWRITDRLKTVCKELTILQRSSECWFSKYDFIKPLQQLYIKYILIYDVIMNSMACQIKIKTCLSHQQKVRQTNFRHINHVVGVSMIYDRVSVLIYHKYMIKAKDLSCDTGQGVLGSFGGLSLKYWLASEEHTCSPKCLDCPSVFRRSHFNI